MDTHTHKIQRVSIQYYTYTQKEKLAYNFKFAFFLYSTSRSHKHYKLNICLVPLLIWNNKTHIEIYVKFKYAET